MDPRRMTPQTVKSQQYEFVAKAMYLVLEQGQDDIKKDMINHILDAASVTVNQD